MKQVRTRYDNEFKLKAVELHLSTGNLSGVSKQLGFYTETLRLWKNLYQEGKLVTGQSLNKVKSKEEIELSRLKKELYEVTLERDILKKAVGIFSKSGK
jgi:transposase